MALLQGLDYIRILKNGEYEIYNSQEERELVKGAPSFEEVRKKYHDELFKLKFYFYKALKVQDVLSKEYGEILPNEYTDGLEKDDRYRVKYKDLIVSFFVKAEKEDKEKADLFHKILDERNAFYKALGDQEIDYNKFCEMRFPFIEQFFPNIHLLKIKPRVTGQFDQLIGKTVEEAYIDVKRHGFFGYTEDV